MPESVHILLSEAGEHEAGATEFAERIVYGAPAAERAFAEMERECQAFIGRCVEIIEANDAMREYNESNYGDVGGGYFYRVIWLEFPTPPSGIEKVADIVAHFMCVEDLTDEKLAGFLRRQEGSRNDAECIDELVMRFCA